MQGAEDMGSEVSRLRLSLNMPSSAIRQSTTKNPGVLIVLRRRLRVLEFLPGDVRRPCRDGGDRERIICDGTVMYESLLLLFSISEASRGRRRPSLSIYSLYVSIFLTTAAKEMGKKKDISRDEII